MILSSEVITDNVAYFRDEAEKCLVAAVASDDPRERAQWTELAYTYHRLAEQLETMKARKANGKRSSPRNALAARAQSDGHSPS